jgi:hypothetical protein
MLLLSDHAASLELEQPDARFLKPVLSLAVDMTPRARNRP